VAILAATLVAWAQSPPITDYIMQGWAILTRSNKNLATARSIRKFRVGLTGVGLSMVPELRTRRKLRRELRAQMPAEDFRKIEIQRLPEDISKISEQGLLYLPKP